MRPARTIAYLPAVLLLWAGASGCVNYSTPLPQAQELSPDEQRFQAVWDASLDVLRRYNFRPDRQDRRAGVITTWPLTGSQFFEFWRPDAVTGYAVAENSLHTIVRTARVQITPRPDEPGSFDANVEVSVARSDQGTPVLSDSSQAYTIYGSPTILYAGVRGEPDRTRTLTDVDQQPDDQGSGDGEALPGDEPSPEATDVPFAPKPLAPPTGYVPLGRDHELERILEERIARRILDAPVSR